MAKPCCNCKEKPKRWIEVGGKKQLDDYCSAKCKKEMYWVTARLSSPRPCDPDHGWF